MPLQLVLKYLSSKTNIVFNQTLFTLFRERYAVMTPSNYFTDPFERVFSTNKGEILSWKSVKPCKNLQNSRAYYTRTKDKSGSNSPPFQSNVQIPASPSTMRSQMTDVCRAASSLLPSQNFARANDPDGHAGH